MKEDQNDTNIKKNLLQEAFRWMFDDKSTYLPIYSTQIESLDNILEYSFLQGENKIVLFACNIDPNLFELFL